MSRVMWHYARKTCRVVFDALGAQLIASDIKLDKLPSIDDRGQTDRVTILLTVVPTQTVMISYWAARDFFLILRYWLEYINFLRPQGRFDHFWCPYGHADRRVWLLAWCFVSVFCSNCSSKTHRLEIGTCNSETDGRTDGYIEAWLDAPTFDGHVINKRCDVGMIVERTEWNTRQSPRAAGNFDRSSRNTREWRFVTFLFSLCYTSVTILPIFQSIVGEIVANLHTFGESHSVR